GQSSLERSLPEHRLRRHLLQLPPASPSSSSSARCCETAAAIYEDKKPTVLRGDARLAKDFEELGVRQVPL
ncbi:unnamed protein product, partial [Urochloa humidicola]